MRPQWKSSAYRKMRRLKTSAISLFVMLPMWQAGAQGPPISLTPPSVVQGSEAKSKTGEALLYTFGNWKITYTALNKAYHLTGSSTKSSPLRADRVGLSCHLDGDRGLIVPIWEYDLENRRNVTLTFWSDDQSSHDIRLPIEGHVMAMDRSSRNPSVTTFAHVLAASKGFFALSYDGKTLEFDVKHLPTANKRFAELCKNAPRP
jgi:hypothetical protein